MTTFVLSCFDFHFNIYSRKDFFFTVRIQICQKDTTFSDIIKAGYVEIYLTHFLRVRYAVCTAGGCLESEFSEPFQTGKQFHPTKTCTNKKFG